MKPWRWLKNTTRRFTALFLAGISLSVAIAACTPNANTSGTGQQGQASTVDLTLVSFAVTKAAHDRIIPKFVEKWQQEHNQTVRINASYGGSGSQTRAVIDGLEADIVQLALALDTERIEQAGLIEPGWEQEYPNNSIVSQSVPVIVTRAGNPQNIQNWQDLARDGVQLITADPKTSGVARWNFLALWGSVTENGGTEQQAQEFVRQVYQNVPILTRDAREATDVFYKQGQGNVLINYENEIILAAQQGGQQLPYVIPDVNISIDNPVAIVDRNVDRHGTREVAQAFVEYLFTPEAQAEFAAVGFRPVDASVAQRKEVADKYAPVNNLFTVQDLGGWDTIQQQFFEDGAVFDQIRAGN